MNKRMFASAIFAVMAVMIMLALGPPAASIIDMPTAFTVPAGDHLAVKSQDVAVNAIPREAREFTMAYELVPFTVQHQATIQVLKTKAPTDIAVVAGHFRQPDSGRFIGNTAVTRRTLYAPG